MSETSYSVSETAKLLDVQSHVLRFWEDELHLPIDRNEMGHRYYTRYDIQVLLAIKELKKKGLALKEIGSLIPFLYKDEENREEAVHSKKTQENTPKQPQPVKSQERSNHNQDKPCEPVRQRTAEPAEQKREMSAARGICKKSIRQKEPGSSEQSRDRQAAAVCRKGRDNRSGQQGTG